MKFGQIITATGINQEDFPELSKLEVSVFDRKKLVILTEITCQLTLESRSMQCFKNFLKTLSSTSIEGRIWVKIGIQFFTIGYPPNYKPNFFFLENKKEQELF